MNLTTVSHIWLPHGGLQLTSGEQKLSSIALSLGAVRSNPRLNSACNLHADVEIDDCITHLAPPWGSAVDFGGAETRPRIALSLIAVRSNPRLNSACYLHADVEFDDSITHLAPPWGSAVHFGGPETRLRIALSLGAAR